MTYEASHMLHLCLSPVCSRVWTARLSLRENCFPHIIHGKRGPERLCSGRGKAPVCGGDPNILWPPSEKHTEYIMRAHILVGGCMHISMNVS